jgi:hypothetical protein
MKRWDVFRDPKWILDNFLAKYKLIRVPTNYNWVMSNVGSGSVAQTPTYLSPRTGVTASSRALAFVYEFGLNSGGISQWYIDWTKRLELEFFISRLNSDAEAVARFQLKESETEGQLAERGIGIQISNYTMVGESYGTARGTVNLATLTDGIAYRIKIVKTASAVEFWVNGVLIGTITTAAAIPNVQGDAQGRIVASIINGVTGGVNACLYISNIIITQEW